MKKVLSFVLATILVFSAFSLVAVAERKEETVPVIVLQGYSGPTLVYTDENGEPLIDPETGDVIKAWHFDLGALATDLLAAIPGGAIGTVTDKDAIKNAIFDVLAKYLSPIGVHPDGSSRENLTYYPKGAAATQVSALIENDMQEYIPESVFVETAIEYVGAENVFGFTFDWRKSQVDYAKAIDEYIQEVKEITGSDKVDLMGLSHGGQYGTSYLYYYGDKHDVRNAFLANPATFGTTVVGSLFTGEPLDIDAQNLMKFIEYSFDLEEDYNPIFKILTLDEIKYIINDLLLGSELVQNAAHIPSLLDFVPNDRFDDVVAYTGLSAEENGKAYYDTVEFHTNLAAGDNLAKKLEKLRSEGMKIGHLVGLGYESINGQGNNGDLVIDAYLSSGSYCAPLGETFPEGYVQQNTNCKNPNHYHISPEFNLDASTGFSPDHTWYAIGQGHGQYFNDPYTRQIVCEFLWGKLENVFSDERYPQFNYTQKHADNVYVHFDNTDAGYHSSADTQLVIDNLSNTSAIHIRSVNIKGAEMDYVYETKSVLQVGEKLNIDISHTSPESADTPFEVKVLYSIDNTQHTVVCKSFFFTAISDEDLQQYPHLAKNAVEEPTEPDDGEEIPTPPAQQEKPTEPDTDEPATEEKDPVIDVEIPDTDSTDTVATSLPLILCVLSIIIASAVLKKKQKA